MGLGGSLPRSHVRLLVGHHRRLARSNGTDGPPPCMARQPLDVVAFFAGAHLPTPVWATGSRIYLTMQLGASWQSGAFGYAAELTASVAAAFSVTLLALPSWTSASVPEAVWLTGLAAVAVLPGVYWLICRTLNRKFCPLQNSFRRQIDLSGLYLWNFLCYGAAHLCLLQGLGVKLPPWDLVLGVSALAWALGTLNIFSPSGLGTREVVLIYGLRGYLSPPELIAFSASMRLIAVAGEFNCVGHRLWLAALPPQTARRQTTPHLMTIWPPM